MDDKKLTYWKLKWTEALPVRSLVGKDNIPKRPGVYVFSDSTASLIPNPRLPLKSDPNYERHMQKRRPLLHVIYVGKATNLRTRIIGYKFIKRGGRLPKRVADRHKGRALLHAHQYFAEEGLEPPLYVRWAIVDGGDDLLKETEGQLIRELNPALNTYGR